MPAKKQPSKPRTSADKKAGRGCPGATCSAGSPTFDEIVAARKTLYEKFDYPPSTNENEESFAWMQWRRMRTPEDLCGYVWGLLENGISMRSEMGHALLEIMSRLRNAKHRTLQMDAMVEEILKQNSFYSYGPAENKD
jgi:hypothetical protein